MHVHVSGTHAMLMCVCAMHVRGCVYVIGHVCARTCAAALAVGALCGVPSLDNAARSGIDTHASKALTCREDLDKAAAARTASAHL